MYELTKGAISLEMGIAHGLEEGYSDLGTRGFGVLRAVGGYAEMGAASFLTSSGVLSPLGIALGLHGAVDIYAGMEQAYTGEYKQSFTEQGLTKIGLSEESASVVDSVFGVAGVFGAGKLAQSFARLSFLKAESSVLNGVRNTHPLSKTQIHEIQSIPHGQRPNPSTYLKSEYIEEHFSQFDNGASRFSTKSNLEKYGIGQRDGTSFVLPKHQADAILAEAKGSKRAIEKSLGLPEKFLESNELVRVDIPKPRDFNLRIPSGNEVGANNHWIPGGKLPNGHYEGVIDVHNISSNQYWYKKLLF